MLKYKELLEQAGQKAAAASAILEGETPNVEEANKLIAEAKTLRERATAMKTASDLKAETVKAVEDFEKAKSAPTNSGIVVGPGEIDKKVKAAQPLYPSLGAMLVDLASGREGPELRAIKGGPEVENGYDLARAIGAARVGSVNPETNKALCDGYNKAILGMSETVPADGGLLVGTDIDTNIMGRVYDVGSLLAMVSTVPITTNANSLEFFREAETSRATGSRRGGIRFYWAAEGDDKTESKPTFERFRLTLHKAIGLVYATDELLQDAGALESWIMSNLPEELRFGVEAAMIAGTGTGMPQGIIGENCVISVTKETNQAADTVVAENIIKMWARRWVSNTDYVWLMNQQVEQQLQQMALAVGTGGMLVYLPPGGLTAAPYGMLFGRPVRSIEYCPALGDNGDIILWSPREYQMIDKGGVQSASSIHVRFINDETTFRFVLRVDGKSKWSSALTPYTAGSTTPDTVSPIVTLAERA